jgi:non-homologous end joining protein Ku
MAEAAKKSSGNTDLFVGTLKAAVGLFGTNAKPSGLPGFATAGPNGGALKFEMRGAPAEPEAREEPVDGVPAVEGKSDPLATAEDPGREAPRLMESTVPSEAGAVVAGEFRRVLVEERSGEVVEPEQVRRGVRLDDGRFIDCTEQLDAIETQTKLDRMDIVKCIDSTRIRRQRVVGAYFVGGQDAKSKAVLKLLHTTLRRRREVAVVKYTTRSRQQLGVIEADHRTGTLMLLSLVWSEDWREAPAKAQLAEVEVPEGQVEKMGALLGALHGHVDVLDTLRDDAIALREELLARALAGEMADVIEPLPAAEPEVDLEAALAASLDAVTAGKV